MFRCFQTASAEHIFWHREVGEHPGGPLPVSAPVLGPVLLLRVEGREIHRQGKESHPSGSSHCLRDINLRQSSVRFGVCAVRLTALPRPPPTTRYKPEDC